MHTLGTHHERTALNGGDTHCTALQEYLEEEPGISAQVFRDLSVPEASLVHDGEHRVFFFPATDASIDVLIDVALRGSINSTPANIAISDIPVTTGVIIGIVVVVIIVIVVVVYGDMRAGGLYLGAAISVVIPRRCRSLATIAIVVGTFDGGFRGCDLDALGPYTALSGHRGQTHSDVWAETMWQGVSRAVENLCARSGL